MFSSWETSVYNKIESYKVAKYTFNLYAHKFIVHIKLPGHGKTERVSLLHSPQVPVNTLNLIP
jgi:hypothetical protein